MMITEAEVHMVVEVMVHPLLTMATVTAHLAQAMVHQATDLVAQTMVQEWAQAVATVQVADLAMELE